LSSTVYNWFAPLRKPLSQRQSVLLVFLCTFIGAAAQILMKLGANRLPSVTTATLEAHLPAIFMNVHLWAGLSLYGMFTALLLLALRDGELSILYPVIALNYVWVTFLSIALFRETLNPWKALGITTIVAGVVILGRGSKR
jgi:drug/metabolite transporter (DMT)-like permease